MAVLAWQVTTGGVLAGHDLRITLWLASHRQGWLTRAMLAVSEVHRTVGILGATAAVAAWLLWLRRRREALALLVIPAAMLLNVGMKNVFQRIRPALDEPLVHLTTFSFPSGHAVASTVFYGTLCGIALAHLRTRSRRIAAIAAALSMVVLVCFSRVYLGAHFLTDVVAGVAMGAAWLLLARRALS
ncbi:phosphatase PAP2 family protein [Ramlibacter terrae]|uniref:Phosphatase PAP2 family protein n=1 Tax=Ramlibacter terrae TaxID=2732511 RepID=A0ABX6P5L8_9BURK|nr:phosphatase PAP2 family protein [Ramlibacter terrae]